MKSVRNDDDYYDFEMFVEVLVKCYATINVFCGGEKEKLEGNKSQWKCKRKMGKWVGG